MQKIFSHGYDKQSDDFLISKSLHGSEEALVELISKHQNYIYNIAFKMVLSPFDAEDITQEVIIKVITKLGQYNGKSSFRTWLYKITVNHFLTMKKTWLEERYPTFSHYELELENISDQDLSPSEQVEWSELIEEARQGCLAGMLLCLTREQRIVFILGEIFSVPHDIGAEIMSISKDNFRQRLKRSRNDLYHFMNKKCGLVNDDNPCRCPKKLKGFIREGWVDPTTLKFNVNYSNRIYQIVEEKDSKLKKMEYLNYKQLQQDYSFQEKDFISKVFKDLIQSKMVKEVFELSGSNDE